MLSLFEITKSNIGNDTYEVTESPKELTQVRYVKIKPKIYRLRNNKYPGETIVIAEYIYQT